MTATTKARRGGRGTKTGAARVRVVQPQPERNLMAEIEAACAAAAAESLSAACEQLLAWVVRLDHPVMRGRLHTADSLRDVEVAQLRARRIANAPGLGLTLSESDEILAGMQAISGATMPPGTAVDISRLVSWLQTLRSRARKIEARAEPTVTATASTPRRQQLATGLTYAHLAILWALSRPNVIGLTKIDDLCVMLDAQLTPDAKTIRAYVRELAVRDDSLVLYIQGAGTEITDGGRCVIHGWEPADAARPWLRQ